MKVSIETNGVELTLTDGDTTTNAIIDMVVAAMLAHTYCRGSIADAMREAADSLES